MAWNLQPRDVLGAIRSIIRQGRLFGLEFLRRLRGDPSQLGDEGLAPEGTGRFSLCNQIKGSRNKEILPGILVNVFVEFGKIKCSLLVAHGHGFLICSRQLLRVPRVDDDTAVQTLSGSREFREDQNAVAVSLRGDVFIGDEIHPVSGGGHDARIGDGVERKQLVKVDGLVQEVDGHKLHSACFM